MQSKNSVKATRKKKEEHVGKFYHFVRIAHAVSYNMPRLSQKFMLKTSLTKTDASLLLAIYS